MDGMFSDIKGLFVPSLFLAILTQFLFSGDKVRKQQCQLIPHVHLGTCLSSLSHQAVREHDLKCRFFLHSGWFPCTSMKWLFPPPPKYAN